MEGTNSEKEDTVLGATTVTAEVPAGPDQEEEGDVMFRSIDVLAHHKNSIDTNSATKPNAIRTTKFTLLNWLPKSIFVQFRRVANIYFLGISVLMTIGTAAPQLFISPLDPIPTIVTLLAILLVTSVKEGYEDLQRRRSDKYENNREVTVISFDEKDGSVKETTKKSKQLHPGEIVKLVGTTPAPADLLLILTSLHSDGNKCYIETANIDGETNLKLREAPPVLSMEMGEQVVAGEPVPELFCGRVRIEEPNANIHKIVGTLHLEATQAAVPIDAQNVILRSAVFSNTEWAYGVVVYTGQETKIQKNSMHAPSKMSKLEQNLNTAIIIIFIAQISLVTISVICIYILGFDDTDKLPYVYPPGSGTGSILPLWLELWFVFFLLYNNFIPLSLYVTIEIVNLGQAYLIASDEEIYHEGLDVPCTVRASNLVQELGMVSNIFTDKTGTLTCNEMQLVKYVLQGKIYNVRPALTAGANEATGATVQQEEDEDEDDSGDDDHEADGVGTKSATAPSPPSRTQLVDSHSSVSFRWQQDNKYGDAKDLFAFLRCLMTCHTVVKESNGTYRAESPDELALVMSATESYDCLLVERGSREITVNVLGKPYTYQIMAVNPFNADRKRMSVLLRDMESEEYLMVCKGADNIMMPLCRTADVEERKMSRALLKLANLGLRTLVVAQRYLSKEEATKWLKMHRNSMVATMNRDGLMAAAGAELERGMQLVGATAIEDRLQDDVPQVIEDMAKAGIIVWMLTGDKLETAVNIGHSCNLLLPTTNTIMLAGLNSQTEFAEALDREYHKLMDRTSTVNTTTMTSGTTTSSSGKVSSTIALVLEGPSFAYFDGSSALQREQLLAIGRACRSVIACRLTPIQKRELVKITKEDRSIKPAPTTLSVGDGANDVSMILEANVGVGIFGKEGRQAANNADFAIGEFKFLRRLLFVHGRWNYVRQSKTFLYSMHKNMVITMTLFWFSFYTAMSGASPYESWVYSGFNFILGLPIIFFGILDRDVSAEFAQRCPQVYSTGRTNVLLNVGSICQWIANAMMYALVIGLMYYVVLFPTFYHMGLYMAGTNIMVGMILALQAKVMFFHHQWVKYQVYSMLFSFFGMYLYYMLIAAAVPEYWNEAIMTYQQGIFWLFSLLTVPLTVIHIDWIAYFLRYLFAPTQEMLFRELELRDLYDDWNRLTCWSTAAATPGAGGLGLGSGKSDGRGAYTMADIYSNDSSMEGGGGTIRPNLSNVTNHSSLNDEDDEGTGNTGQAGGYTAATSNTRNRKVKGKIEPSSVRALEVELTPTTGSAATASAENEV